MCETKKEFLAGDIEFDIVKFGQSQISEQQSVATRCPTPFIPPPTITRDGSEKNVLFNFRQNKNISNMCFFPHKCEGRTKSKCRHSQKYKLYEYVSYEKKIRSYSIISGIYSIICMSSNITYTLLSVLFLYHTFYCDVI